MRVGSPRHRSGKVRIRVPGPKRPIGRPRRPVETKSCLRCGASFVAERPKQRYCSQVCVADSRRKGRAAHLCTCVICGAAFQSRFPDSKTCSRTCKNTQIGRAGHLTRRRQARKCAVCGGVFEPKTARAKTCGTTACVAAQMSAGIRAAKAKGSELEERTCAICAVAYVPRRASQATCGSLACRNESMIRKTKRLTTRRCPQCGVEFEPVNANSTYCSRRCGATHSQRDRKVTLVPRPCLTCSKVFSPARPEQVCCTPECGRQRTQQAKLRLGTIPCRHCGERFAPRDALTVFCSRPCSVRGKKKGSHLAGRLHSEKIGAEVTFDSMYELAFLLHLEFASSVVSFVREPCAIPYEFQGEACNYYPDFEYTDAAGVRHLCEIKSKVWERRDPKVPFKLAAGRKHCEQAGMIFHYYTEEDALLGDLFARYSEQIVSVYRLLLAKDGFEARSCETCRAPIPVGDSVARYRRTKYCSRLCRARAKRPSARATKSCKNCGESIPLHRVFCSKRCYSQAQKVLAARSCPVCGSAFLPRGTRQRTCGSACGVQQRTRTRVESGDFRAPHARASTCAACGRSFVAKDASRKYCSTDCYHQARRGHTDATCPTCGRTFYNYTGRLTYCSRRCIPRELLGRKPRPGGARRAPRRASAQASQLELPLGVVPPPASKRRQ